jgi:hypothetical protein
MDTDERRLSGFRLMNNDFTHVQLRISASGLIIESNVELSKDLKILQDSSLLPSDQYRKLALQKRGNYAKKF